MIDEFARLKKEHGLFQLLGSYVPADAADREAWLDRCMELDGIDGTSLSRLHGELLAFGWVEQNTGFVIAGQPGVCPQSYRATAAGRRAFQRASADQGADLEEAA